MLAVLPFKNLGPPEDAYFADGITEELTSRLASVAGSASSPAPVRTSIATRASHCARSRASSAPITCSKEASAGSAWKRGAAACASRPSSFACVTTNHLWTKIYDEELSGVFEVQTRIAEHVASALSVALAGDERHHMEARPTENLAAWDAYMRGSGCWRAKAATLLQPPGNRDAYRSDDSRPAFRAGVRQAQPRPHAAVRALLRPHGAPADARPRRGRIRIRVGPYTSGRARRPRSHPREHRRVRASKRGVRDCGARSSQRLRHPGGHGKSFDASGQWDEGSSASRAGQAQSRSPEANFAAAEGFAITHDYAGARRTPSASWRPTPTSLVVMS